MSRRSSIASFPEDFSPVVRTGRRERIPTQKVVASQAKSRSKDGVGLGEPAKAKMKKAVQVAKKFVLDEAEAVDSDVSDLLSETSADRNFIDDNAVGDDSVASAADTPSPVMKVSSRVRQKRRTNDVEARMKAVSSIVVADTFPHDSDDVFAGLTEEELQELENKPLPVKPFQVVPSAPKAAGLSKSALMLHNDACFDVAAPQVIKETSKAIPAWVPIEVMHGEGTHRTDWKKAFEEAHIKLDQLETENERLKSHHNKKMQDMAMKLRDVAAEKKILKHELTNLTLKQQSGAIENIRSENIKLMKECNFYRMKLRHTKSAMEEVMSNFACVAYKTGYGEQ